MNRMQSFTTFRAQRRRITFSVISWYHLFVGIKKSFDVKKVKQFYLNYNGVQKIFYDNKELFSCCLEKLKISLWENWIMIHSMIKFHTKWSCDHLCRLVQELVIHLWLYFPSGTVVKYLKQCHTRKAKKISRFVVKNIVKDRLDDVSLPSLRFHRSNLFVVIFSFNIKRSIYFFIKRSKNLVADDGNDDD